MIVGHVLRKISAACSLFLRANDTINCIVTAGRRFSADLPQGGLEVPCKLMFKGQNAFVTKIKKLVLPIIHPAEELACKRRKIDTSISLASCLWICINARYHLNEEEKSVISSRGQLTDKHINFALEILKKQFPSLNGLRCTLLLAKQNGISMLNSPNHVKIYDSLHFNVDEQTIHLIRSLFGQEASFELHNSPRQKGYNDCGLFAIANCVSLVHWCEPKSFDQESMRPHLIKCFEQRSFSPFPVIQ